MKQRFRIIGNSPEMNRAIDVAIQVAPTDLTVLITGESGAGKDVFPRIIHENSLRKTKKYLAVNCGAIPEGTIDSELFGHIKGAFTNAISDRKGYFGEADGGTIFLDEVAELPLATQARLLRVLESGEFIRVGSSTVEKTNVRIVAATNVDLLKAIEQGRFREDLFYRLSTIPIKVPPLRERGADVLLLFRKFAADCAEKYRMPAVQLSEDAKQMLMTYHWPGNVRQLKNITEQISVLSPERLITADILRHFIPEDHETTQLATIPREGGDHSFENEREILYKILFELRGNVNDMRREMSALKKQLDDVQGGTTPVSTPIPTTQLAPITPASLSTLHAPLSTAEDAVAEEYVEPEKEQENLNLSDLSKQMLEKALERNHGNRKRAAQELGISDRTLYRRLKQYGLDK